MKTNLRDHLPTPPVLCDNPISPCTAELHRYMHTEIVKFKCTDFDSNAERCKKHARAYFNRLNDHAILMKKMEAVSSIVNLTSLSESSIEQ